jgi:hypothetical protein
VETKVYKLREILGAPTRELVRVPWELGAIAPSGLRFPTDYQWLMDTYGSIRIRGDLRVWIPMKDRGFDGFVWHTADAGEQVGVVHDDPKFDETADAPPYEMFPELGGLLAWGGDNRGNFLFWLTVDPDPDRWPVVVWIQDLEEWDLFPGGTVAFLVALLSGEYRLGDELLGDPNELLWEFEADWSSRY